MTTFHDDSFDPFLRELLAAVNAGHRPDDAYHDDAITVRMPGHVIDWRTGADYLAGLGVPMTAAVRHAYVVGDTALLVVDWALRGTAVDGTEIDQHGTATDVLRRGPDGRWRYLIDNPHGSA
jgi:ketosteroid isomerase-like protein